MAQVTAQPIGANLVTSVDRLAAFAAPALKSGSEPGAIFGLSLVWNLFAAPGAR
jgi:hypothetical protein